MSDEIESMRKCNRCKASFTLDNFKIKNKRGECTKTSRGLLIFLLLLNSQTLLMGLYTLKILMINA